jgi:D-alanyl-D-alanine dipeptidase
MEEMFKALYGDSEEEVAKSCVVVSFCGHKVRFSARCGAALALEAVGKDLEALFATRPELREYVSELGGTFAWRYIAGTKRLSNHSFGNAIDLNVKKSAYWRWSPASTLETFSRKDWPVGIIEAFEKHGFIWGGKWWHYDTMHFEFRPELIAQAKASKAG